MMNARDAWEKRKRTSLSVDQAKMAALEDEGLVTIGGDEAQKPDLIVGGHWPARIPGAYRISCADCNAFVALSPDSGGAMKALWPDVPVVCINCARPRAEAAE